MQNKKTVLIVDDDRDLVEVLAARCRDRGLEALTAHTCLDAVRIADTHHPDLMLLDVNMPDGSGLDICEMLSAHPRLAQIPVIVLAGTETPETARRSHSTGSYYVPKGANAWQRVEPLLDELAPQTDAGQHASPSSRRSQTAAEDRPLPTILCIDDDDQFSETVKLRLESWGARVIRAAAGTDGLRMAFTHAVEAVMLDYSLPNGRGDYILGRLKDNPVTSIIPVVVVTGHRERSLERKLIGMGAAGCFFKPVEFNKLWAELCEHIRGDLRRSLISTSNN